MRLVLYDGDFAVEHSISHNDALMKAEHWLPDLVCVDVGFDMKPALDFARSVRQSPLLSGTFLIALSAWSEKTYTQQMRAAGFNDYVIKPLNFPDLTLLIRNLLVD